MGRLWWGEEGQGLAEYGWTIVLVAIVVILILGVLGMIAWRYWFDIYNAWNVVWGVPTATLTP
jgi:hypothetical protein